LIGLLNQFLDSSGVQVSSAQSSGGQFG